MAENVDSVRILLPVQQVMPEFVADREASALPGCVPVVEDLPIRAALGRNERAVESVEIVAEDLGDGIVRKEILRHFLGEFADVEAVAVRRLLCCSFAANAVRLQLHAPAYNLANFMRTLALPAAIKQWSLTSLREELVKTAAKVVRHGRYVIFQMAKVAVPKELLQGILRLIGEIRPRKWPGQPFDRGLGCPR